MSTQGGVGGRVVPGAAFVEDSNPAGHKKKKKRSKGKSKQAEKEPEPESIEQHDDSGADAGSEGNGYEKIDAERPSDASSTGGDGYVHVDGEERSQERSQERPEGPRPKAMDDMPISTEQLLDEPATTQEAEAEEEEPEDTNPASLWLKSKTEHPYKSFSEDLKEKMVEHLTNHVSSDYDPTWMREVRQTIWRACVRANWWWVNPDTGQWTHKQAPVQINDGVWSGNFEAFVECNAMRLDRVGRDLAPHDYVRKIEEDVREFLFRAEKNGHQTQLEHLAFLLMVDETKRHPRVLELRELQERVALAFLRVKMDWKGLNYVKAGPRLPPLSTNDHPGIGETVWRAAIAELEI